MTQTELDITSSLLSMYEFTTPADIYDMKLKIQNDTGPMHTVCVCVGGGI